MIAESLTLLMQEEHRAIHPKYHFAKDTTNQQAGGQGPDGESRGKKRARAEDFL